MLHNVFNTKELLLIEMTEQQNWGYHIKRLREARGMTQAELANRSGLGRGHISRIETGGYKSTSQDTFEKLARGLGIPLSELSSEIRGEEPKTLRPKLEHLLELARLAQPVAIPIYSDFPIHAGQGVEPVEYVYRERLGATPPNIEGYLVHGRCLEPDIREGEIIIVDRDAEPKAGDIVASLIDGVVYLGKLKRIEGKLYLVNNEEVINIETSSDVAKVIEKITRFA